MHKNMTVPTYPVPMYPIICPAKGKFEELSDFLDKNIGVASSFLTGWTGKLGSPIKGRVKRKNTSPAKKHTCFSFTLQLLSAMSLSC